MRSFALSEVVGEGRGGSGAPFLRPLPSALARGHRRCVLQSRSRWRQGNCCTTDAESPSFVENRAPARSSPPLPPPQAQTNSVQTPICPSVKSPYSPPLFLSPSPFFVDHRPRRFVRACALGVPQDEVVPTPAHKVEVVVIRPVAIEADSATSRYQFPAQDSFDVARHGKTAHTDVAAVF